MIYGTGLGFNRPAITAGKTPLKQVSFGDKTPKKEGEEVVFDVFDKEGGLYGAEYLNHMEEENKPIILGKRYIVKKTEKGRNTLQQLTLEDPKTGRCFEVGAETRWKNANKIDEEDQAKYDKRMEEKKEEEKNWRTTWRRKNAFKSSSCVSE
jgi:hypothetical protein